MNTNELTEEIKPILDRMAERQGKEFTSVSFTVTRYEAGRFHSDWMAYVEVGGINHGDTLELAAEPFIGNSPTYWQKQADAHEVELSKLAAQVTAKRQQAESARKKALELTESAVKHPAEPVSESAEKEVVV